MQGALFILTDVSDYFGFLHPLPKAHSLIPGNPEICTGKIKTQNNLSAL